MNAAAGVERFRLRHRLAGDALADGGGGGARALVLAGVASGR